jgi:hypothetical protein
MGKSSKSGPMGREGLNGLDPGKKHEVALSEGSSKRPLKWNVIDDPGAGNCAFGGHVDSVSGRCWANERVKVPHLCCMVTSRAHVPKRPF